MIYLRAEPGQSYCILHAKLFNHPELEHELSQCNNLADVQKLEQSCQGSQPTEKIKFPDISLISLSNSAEIS